MFSRTSVLSLVLPIFIRQVLGIELDVNSQASIKSAAKTLAGGIVSAYKETLVEDGVPGLFADDYYFWEAGTVFNGLIEYSHLTGDSQYNDLISQALQHQLGEFDAFMPPNQTKSLGNDDQSYWGLAAMNAAEIGFPKPANNEWINIATNVFDTQVARYDSEEQEGTCGGGLRWQIFTFNNGYDYKNANTNGNFFVLAARLAKYTGNETYTQYANKVYDWSRKVKLVGDDYAVYDGTSTTSNCSDIQKIRWTAAQGAYTEGAALMHNMTGAQNWTDAVKGFVNASSDFTSNSNGVLVEIACETNGKCNTDVRAYKGIFARHMARAALAAPAVSDSIKKILSASAVAAAKACSDGQDPECSLGWTEETSKWEAAGAKDGNLGEVFGAMEAVQVLLYPGAKALQSGSGDGVKGNGNSTQGGRPSNSTGGPLEHQGAAGSVTVSAIVILAGALVATLAV